MSTLVEIHTVAAQRVTVDEDKLCVDLTDGRTVSVPLAWYPRLFYGTPKERNNWRLIGDGEGIHWPDLDEDISVESIILGRRSGESQRSLKKWLEKRASLEHKSSKRVRLHTHTPSRQKRSLPVNTNS